ncbi:alpha/beta fold hydrolase [Fictibacillus aquaticus]|uniref:Alpha/beta hydrolase n=1 Tax=Fictibacillus aquaticus TaxID=2021314 RepID=A0A235F5H6_9BACL|nr:alpha/beta hydrolase [Fictibacillus aquaticus]OYD56556.1 alpha/beta hydrolase [Fictibacillus aquaticus]
MPYFTLSDQTKLHYTEAGSGTPVIFLHGVWMSSRFFEKQLPYFKEHYQTILLDFRGHGQSDYPPHGHTIETYARDLHEFINGKKLKNVVLAGWSMGAFVVWEYLKQFGDANIKANVIVDEMASDFKWPDFPIGAFDFPTLIHFMRGVQHDRRATLEGFVPLMFKEDLTEKDKDWIMDEVTRMPESIASAILFDQSVVDYRADFPDMKNPSLLCFGRDEKLIPVAAGEHIRDLLPNAKLEIFENSCHCPFLEETDRFNTVVHEFIQSV